MRINQVARLKGSLKVPGDKSISHRAVMLGAIAKGNTLINHFLTGEDCLSTIDCFKQMGIEFTVNSNKVKVIGKGLYGLKKPSSILYTGNSGTTFRLLSGILCGQSFSSTLTGDSSILRRPMGRIIEPLSKMGANIKSQDQNGLPPIHIEPSILHSIEYKSPVASAQVKSAILLASLYADGESSIEEPFISRNHSEIMLRQFGADIRIQDKIAYVKPAQELFGQEITVPSDISSAAYFMVAGLALKNSEVLLKDVGVNPTRDGILKVLQKMNGNIELSNIRIVNGEKIADILLRSSDLNGTTIEGEIIPTLIDEIPIIAVAAAFAQGRTIIKDASELKVKESNRIEAMVSELSKMGVRITSTQDGMIIDGGYPLHGTKLECYHDHRIAMSLAIAALSAEGETLLNNPECISISYPNFFTDLKSLL